MENRVLHRVISWSILLLISVSLSHGQSKISTQWISYRSGEDTVRAYLAMPDTGSSLPALIVIHEWWGLNDWIQQNADEFARRGFVALAIDLYRGSAASSSDEAHELMRGLPEDRAAKDLKAAFAHLAQHPSVNKERIGAIGWCMGGGYSLAAALNIKQLAGAVICYGRLVTENDELQKINCPILGIFGDADRGIPSASAKAFERYAQKLDKNVRVTIYPKVGHAFMNPNNKSGYDEKAATDAWQKIYAFFDVKLKAKK
jgi:carboxymethylenebutenolidase